MCTFDPNIQRKSLRLLTCIALSVTLAGCYAPLVSRGIPASSLPDHYRQPTRSVGEPLNFASLTSPPHAEYLLGPGDILEVVVHDLNPGGEVRPIRAEVMANGYIHLPLVGAVDVGELNLMEAQIAITKAYADGYLKDAVVNAYIFEKSKTPVLVLGEVGQPGVYELPKYENDVAHALAISGGIGNQAGTVIEIHRRATGFAAQEMAIRQELAKVESDPILHVDDVPSSENLSSAETDELSPADSDDLSPDESQDLLAQGEAKEILRIPLRGLCCEGLSPDDVRLGPGDVVVVPSRTNEVFYVVGELDQTNVVRFSSGLEVRDLGVGFLLPRERDLDVVTAVVMAGYIDPINSPTTVTLQRTNSNGHPMLIHVDLIKARYDCRENLMVRAGDIIYLNPDGGWWFRRTLDRIVPDLLSYPYQRSVLKWFGQVRN